MVKKIYPQPLKSHLTIHICDFTESRDTVIARHLYLLHSRLPPEVLARYAPTLPDYQSMWSWRFAN